jgi:hypothetical protein
MKSLFGKSLLVAISTVLLSCSYSLAETEDLIDYRLSLAGYHLGMTYDDATAIRSLLFIQDSAADSFAVVDDYIHASAEQVYVDGIEMNLWLRFKNERLHKIIARFMPDKTEELIRVFKQTLGPGDDQSRNFPDHEGDIIHQTVNFWEFPTAKLYLIRNSDNAEYATIGLTAKPAYMKTFKEMDD